MATPAVDVKAGAACAWPAFERFEAGLRQARRTATTARYATEDLAAETALRVRRHPFAAVGVAAAAGLALGCVGGLAIGLACRTRAAED